MKIRIWIHIQKCDLIACSSKFKLLDRTQCVPNRIVCQLKSFSSLFWRFCGYFNSWKIFKIAKKILDKQPKSILYCQQCINIHWIYSFVWKTRNRITLELHSLESTLEIVFNWKIFSSVFDLRAISFSIRFCNEFYAKKSQLTVRVLNFEWQSDRTESADSAEVIGEQEEYAEYEVLLLPVSAEKAIADWPNCHKLWLRFKHRI